MPSFLWHVSFPQYHIGYTDVSPICMAILFLGSSWKLFETAFAIFPAILLPIRLPTGSASFWFALFETVLKELVAEFFVLLRFCPYLLLRFLPMFFAKDIITKDFFCKKLMAFDINLISDYNWTSHYIPKFCLLPARAQSFDLEAILQHVKTMSKLPFRFSSNFLW